MLCWLVRGTQVLCGLTTIKVLDLRMSSGSNSGVCSCCVGVFYFCHPKYPFPSIREVDGGQLVTQRMLAESRTREGLGEAENPENISPRPTVMSSAYLPEYTCLSILLFSLIKDQPNEPYQGLAS